MLFGHFSFSAGEHTRAKAACIHTRLVAELNTSDWGVKEANFQVIREADCPAVLVEVAFINLHQKRTVSS
ncbi:N-acetylmuramoyl-L-alanine amidase [Pelosinus sp. IPA-1]|uniref:N-acetylmuramoyl-L-alanine amidase family protein n=1 Tax=Pelosinus sp. IPA-1 TaxID=3029569 RepID=UPI00243628DE|nr:N-acetylmuramoyl-L-alanine amidase [Pelosinus sp. IPA-1]GMB01556.1 hypothetical protein PIPA1_43550 [Pelosinus sp. IPA-1]